MRIWDSLFSDTNRFDFLIYMCCSMIVYVNLENASSDLSLIQILCSFYRSIREKLIAGDFSEAVKLLQVLHMYIQHF